MDKIMQAATTGEVENMPLQLEVSGPSVEEAGIVAKPFELVGDDKVESLTSGPKLSATSEPTPDAPIASNSAPIPANRNVAWIPLTEFKYFSKLPFELRSMIYVIAIKDYSPRILAIQPQYREHPGLIHAWKESHEACTKYYYYCASKQRCKFFRFFIDYRKDILYLNHPFTLLGGKCQQSPLQSTHTIYPEFLELIETLAMNLKEVRNLSGDHRGKNTIWLMLSKWCPNLKELKVVVNNLPTNGLLLDFKPIMTAKVYKEMIDIPKQRAIEEISGSFKKAKKHYGLVTELQMRLVVIDESAPKVKSKKERAVIAEAWKKANMKVNGVSEVDQIVTQLEGGATGSEGAGIGSSGGAKKDKKASETSKLPAKLQKAGNGKLAKNNSGKFSGKPTVKARK
ncbi:hypothetical protein ONS95_000533 [Cadophora gregata]|uniref:uncharacterized protein n=1 Tax=Cadophora gregata TaxID=51156 RepID=UPI0026DB0058|nr:uncharacterized protein ONS95_000533 [Cadophora gregata]KAK0128569.1 hypothetical protein ONS95_000533 [Cadophora gregata]